MASENDPTATPEASAAPVEPTVEPTAPVEKPKRRRATKKAAAPAPQEARADDVGTAPAEAVVDGPEPDPSAAPAPRKRAAKRTTKAGVKESKPKEAKAKETKAKETKARGRAKALVEEPVDGAEPGADTLAPEAEPVVEEPTDIDGPAADEEETAWAEVTPQADATAHPASDASAEPAPDASAEATAEAAPDASADATAEADAIAEPTPEETPTPVVPSFGLLFQAPEPVAPRRRRATSPAQAPVERPAADEGSDADGEPAADTETAEAAGEEAERPTDERPTDEAEAGGRSRRRRGGRGRRGRSQAEDDQAGTASADTSAEGEEADDTGPAEDDADADGGSTRRRRRRRRGGSSGDAEDQDPPGTVTRVREPRSQREEPTAVKGSTRLEAKKQRRREGREAGRRRTVITEAEFLARRESVERVMVVRGRGDRTQIGVLEDGVLVEHYVSRETTASMAGNVYLGRVQNVLPSMEAAFVDIGKGRNAVLYAGEVNWDAAGLEGGQARRIENALTSGDTVLVQVTKDPIGHKGARLTSQVSLPGRYLVYVPEGQMTGISRKLPDTERARLKAILKQVVPDSAGVIVRTAAEGASEEELRADVERLTKIWDKIKARAESAGAKKSGSGGAPALLHGEPDLTVRVIRDVFTEDFTSLVVSGDKAWSEVSQYVEDVAPDLAPRLQRWTAEEDVFAAHRIDEALAKAMDRKVWLPSGGSLVIDRTEAMTVVDVNTGKFVGSGGNLEETVTKNNLEAAEEIVRQLRLRDIGGIIVIDFIDMVLESNRDLVVRRLLECLGRDRTKHQVAEVTSLGLVQMTRKRVGSGLIEVFSEPCEHCAGRGIVVHTEPVDRGGSSDSGGSGQGGSRSGRGRRGGSAGAAPSGSSGSGSDSGAAEEPRTPSGPTAAQIAAAAHAAALRKAEAAESSDVGAPAGSAQAAPVLEPDAGASPEPSDAGASLERSDAGTSPEPSDAGASLERSDADASPEPVAATDAVVEPTPAPVDEERPPAHTGLLATVAGVASAVAHALTAHEPDAKAPAPSTHEPVGTASEPVGTAAPEPVGTATAPEPVGSGPASEPSPAPRARRKRGRVVAPAGPPRAAQPETPSSDEPGA